MIVKFLKFELLMLTLGILAGVGCAVFLTLLDTWSLAGTVPSRPTQLTYDSQTLYIKTVDERAYACDTSQKCRLVNTFPPLTDTFAACGTPDSVPPPAPEGVIISMAVRECPYIGGEGHLDTHVIGLENGSLWKWSQSDEPELGAFILICLFAGFGVVGGSGIGLPLFGLWWFFRPVPRMKAKNDTKHS